MILGIGTDIVEVERMREAADKWGDRFLKRIFSDREIRYCYSKKNPFPHLSARFAAKEAAVKALSGIINDRRVLVADIEVSNESSGRPVLSIKGAAKELTARISFHVTLSHEKDYAVATVIAEQI